MVLNQLIQLFESNYKFWLKIRTGPYELQAKNEPETAVQKLNRIQCELAELQEELATPKVYLLVLVTNKFAVY